MPNRVYISGIIPEGQSLPQKVKDKLTDFINKGYGLVITARTRSGVRDEIRLFLNDNHFKRLPKVEFKESRENEPELYQSCPNKAILNGGPGLFLWDGKDPYTLFEMLYYDNKPIELYIFDMDDFVSTFSQGIDFAKLLPGRAQGSISYQQSFAIPDTILNALSLPDHTMKYISGKYWHRKHMLAMINNSNLLLSQKTEMYRLLTEKEDILADLIECHYTIDQHYSTFELIEDSAFFCYEESKSEMNYQRIHPGSGIRFPHLYQSGDIIHFEDGSDAIILDGKTNRVLTSGIDPENRLVFSDHTFDDDICLIHSDLTNRISKELISMVNVFEPYYRKGPLPPSVLTHLTAIIDHLNENRNGPEDPSTFSLDDTKRACWERIINASERFKDYTLLDVPTRFSELFADKRIAFVGVHTVGDHISEGSLIDCFCGVFLWAENKIVSIDDFTYNKDMMIYAYKWMDPDGEKNILFVCAYDWPRIYNHEN